MYCIIFNDVLFSPTVPVDWIYDLKGRAPKPGKALMNTEKGSGYVFKDKDLDRTFSIAGMSVGVCLRVFVCVSLLEGESKRVWIDAHFVG